MGDVDVDSDAKLDVNIDDVFFAGRAFTEEERRLLRTAVSMLGSNGVKQLRWIYQGARNCLCFRCFAALKRG